MVPML